MYQSAVLRVPGSEERLATADLLADLLADISERGRRGIRRCSGPSGVQWHTSRPNASSSTGMDFLTGDLATTLRGETAWY